MPGLPVLPAEGEPCLVTEKFPAKTGQTRSLLRPEVVVNARFGVLTASYVPDNPCQRLVPLPLSDHDPAPEFR